MSKVCFDGSAGGVGIGAGVNPPAQPDVIAFANASLTPDLANEVMDQMADSIVDLTRQLEEANARVAVLEEEQRILARKLLEAAR